MGSLPIRLLAVTMVSGWVTSERHLEGRCYIRETTLGSLKIREDSVCYLPDEVLTSEEIDSHSVIRVPKLVIPKRKHPNAIKPQANEGGPGEVGEGEGVQ